MKIPDSGAADPVILSYPPDIREHHIGDELLARGALTR
jgi:hypothetical protein